MTSIKLVVERSESHWKEFSEAILDTLSNDKQF
jgi:hypothetical protein